MTNPTESPSPLPSPFSSLASRLSAWRSAGRPGRRIPEPFWEEAAALAKVHGLSPTSTILKLNYYHLRRQLDPTVPARKAPPLPPTFLTQPATQAAGLRAENQRLARLPLPNVPALPPDQLLELMKLRGETGQKGQRLAKLQLELDARKNSATALALRTPATTNYFPKAAWATAGNATPEAALQSTSWAMGQAMSRGDIKAMLALLGPDLQARAATEMAGKTDREIQTELADQASRTAREEGFRIVNKQIISPDEVVLTCYVDGSDSFSMMPLKQTANGWQITDMPAKK